MFRQKKLQMQRFTKTTRLCILFDEVTKRKIIYILRVQHSMHWAQVISANYTRHTFKRRLALHTDFQILILLLTLRYLN
jgi:hypothetical protein